MSRSRLLVHIPRTEMMFWPQLSWEIQLYKYTDWTPSSSSDWWTHTCTDNERTRPCLCDTIAATGSSTVGVPPSAAWVTITSGVTKVLIMTKLMIIRTASPWRETDHKIWASKKHKLLFWRGNKSRLHFQKNDFLYFVKIKNRHNLII